MNLPDTITYAGRAYPCDDEGVPQWERACWFVDAFEMTPFDVDLNSPRFPVIYVKVCDSEYAIEVRHWIEYLDTCRAATAHTCTAGPGGVPATDRAGCAACQGNYVWVRANLPPDAEACIAPA